MKQPTQNLNINERAYKKEFYPPVPTGLTKYMRQNLIWQIIRFISINLKMLKVVRKSH